MTEIAAPPRTWTVELPPGTPIITANHRMFRYDLARAVLALRTTASDLARAQHIPVISSRADILVEYTPPPRRKKDRHPLASQRVEDAENLAPTSKACIDGLVDAGVFPSDSRKYVREVAFRLAVGTHPRGLLTLTITEVTDG